LRSGPGQFSKRWGTFDPERLEQMRQRIRKVLARLEQQLEDRRFLVHHNFSLAYICFAPRITILDRLGVQLPSSSVNLQAWINRIRERPSTQGLET
jgi:glutathione S-transferase